MPAAPHPMVPSLPEAEASEGRLLNGKTVDSCSISSWRHRYPTPAELASSCRSAPHPPNTYPSQNLQASLPVRRPSQAQAGLWFISAAPAASLSRLVNRGSLQRRRRGPLWSASGLRIFLGPFSDSPYRLPRKRIWAT